MSHAMVARRCLANGPQFYLDAAEAALAQRESVRVVPTPHMENDIRLFLQQLAKELRYLYPWQVPSVLELSLDNWGQLMAGAEPIGKIDLRQLDVSQRLGIEFGEVGGRREPGLLLRLRSGVVVGLAAPTSVADSGITIFTVPEADVSRVRDEIILAAALQPTDIEIFARRIDGQSSPSGRDGSRSRSLLPDLTPQASGVERWSPQRIARHRVVIDEEGRFRTIDGGVLDTRMASASWRPNAELALFVMDPHGNFYVSLRRVISRVHHSTLSGGGPVTVAGELRVRDGRLLAMTDHSGHYPPTKSDNQIVLGELQRRGVRTTDVAFDFAATANRWE